MKRESLYSATLLMALASGRAVVANEKPPNVVLMLVDDLGWADSSTYGSTYYETPNLDRLAREGMLFTHAYAAAPLCSPTRASIMVGQHPARLRMSQAISAQRSVFEPVALAPEEGQYAGDIRSRDHLPADLVTLADLLREHGYHTAHIGKWHLSRPHHFQEENESMYDAGNRGFDFVIGGNHLPGPPDYYSPYSRSPKNRQNWVSEIPNLDAGPEGEHLDRRLAEEAVRWLDSVRDSEQPFFLNLWTYAVHTPIIPREDLLPKYRGRRDPSGIHDCPEMGTMVESLDESLGVLLDYFDRPENHALRDNTLLIFLSDNGGVIHLRVNNRLITSNRPLRGGKANLYEGGVRVPWVVRFPGRIPANVISEVPIVSTDLFPTILEYAGVPLPAGHVVDGVNLLPLWEGEIFTQQPLFFHFPPVFGILSAPSTTVRLGDYKLLRFHWAGNEPGTHYHELYNLRLDPGEVINLARHLPKHLPEKMRELERLLEQFLVETDALIPIRNEQFEGHPRGRRGRSAANHRPTTLHLDELVWSPEENQGRRVVRLKDEKGAERTTHGMVLLGGDWVAVENHPDGSVEVRWDRALKNGDATLLLGWKGGRDPWEINEWTLDPVELTLR